MISYLPPFAEETQLMNTIDTRNIDGEDTLTVVLEEPWEYLSERYCIVENQKKYCWHQTKSLDFAANRLPNLLNKPLNLS